MDKEHRRDVLLDIVLILEAAVHAGEEIVQARREPAADRAPEQERLDGLADAKECAAIYRALLVDRIEQHQQRPDLLHVKAHNSGEHAAQVAILLLAKEQA